MFDILRGARQELREYLEDWTEDDFEQDEPHDIIHEIADSNVPVYTSDLMQLAADYLPLATNEPELGPAFDGSPTPTNIVAANVYDTITEDLWEEYSKIKDEFASKMDYEAAHGA